MVDRICSLCGESYTDEEGHDYDRCAERCRDRVSILKGKLQAAQEHLAEAQRIQKQDLWRKRK